MLSHAEFREKTEYLSQILVIRDWVVNSGMTTKFRCSTDHVKLLFSRELLLERYFIWLNSVKTNLLWIVVTPLITCLETTWNGKITYPTNARLQEVFCHWYGMYIKYFQIHCTAQFQVKCLILNIVHNTIWELTDFRFYG